ncbi:hypothetical protein [Microbacterium elymi]|uniref:Uncharacterized protein n=1 Tax=Microbacterium elymi TaxID=2909587 RepID=A0ABY5NIC7_9MICO|nr:hypothetical protein [Microbacterium elymi]UUT34920.1 hypothetical protein L2X98_31500 [Microbacterium elymi]
MRTAPAELLETLTRLDELLGDDVHTTLDGDITRTMTDDELVAFARVSESLGRRADALRIAASRRDRCPLTR